jgi:tRNA(Glu) U13 pseudouridine synthase TruD
MNPADTEAGKYEWGRRKHFELTEEHVHLYKPYKLFWLRRSLRVFPTDADHKRQGNDLLLHFTLPKSAYASVVVDLLVGNEAHQ